MLSHREDLVGIAGKVEFLVPLEVGSNVEGGKLRAAGGPEDVGADRRLKLEQVHSVNHFVLCWYMCQDALASILVNVGEHVADAD